MMRMMMKHPVNAGGVVLDEEVEGFMRLEASRRITTASAWPVNASAWTLHTEHSVLTEKL